MRRARMKPQLANNIRAEMGRRNLTRKDMAKALDISASNFDKILADPESRLSVGRLRVIAALVQTPVEALMGN